jgi:drug/metabolite transporter (DMT)-like permease
MELWIIATLLASTFQTLRFTLQKILSSDALSATGATFARFCYALPFLTVGLAVYFGMNAIAFPALNARLLVYAGVGGLTQIFATLCVLSMFKYRNFAVGITFKKTEVILVALVGFVLLGKAFPVWALGLSFWG